MAGLSHQDVAGLNGALGDLSQTLLRKRMMQQQQDEQDRQAGFTQQRIGLDQQRIGIDQARADEATAQFGAQKEHWAKLEQATQFSNSLKKLKETKDSFSDSFRNLADYVDAGETPEEKATRAQAASGFLQSSIDAQDDDVKQAIKQNPQIQAAIQGKVDWSAVARANKRPSAAAKQTATGVDLEKAQDLEDQAAAADEDGDGERADQLRADAKILREAHVKATKPTPLDRVETTTAPGDYDGQPDKVTRKTVRHVPAGANAPEDAAATETAVPEATKRVKGKTYKLPKGNFTWTGNGWLPAK